MSLFLRGAALAALVAVAGCDAADPAPAGDVRLDVEALVGTAPFVAGQTFTLADGRAASLTTARFYLSDLTLLRANNGIVQLVTDPVPVTMRAADGTEAPHTLTERYVLARADEGRAPAELGRLPAGAYTGVRFTVGVTGIDNRINPVELPADHPLALQTPSMFWNWNSGYVFAMLDGLLDVDGDGTPDPASSTPEDSGQWRLHVGLAPNTQTVEILAPFEIEAGETQDLHLQVDLARLVQGVDYDVPANRFCMSFGCQPVVDAYRANLGAAFSFHGVHRD